MVDSVDYPQQVSLKLRTFHVGDVNVLEQFLCCWVALEYATTRDNT